MTSIPVWLRRAPFIFYVAALLILILGLTLPLHELSRLGYSSKIPMDAAVHKSVITDLVIRVASDALYMFANGAILQVLIAIFDRCAGRAEEPEE
jgi:hypothetical protein